MEGTAQSVRVIGKGNKERLVPLLEAFGQVFGFWLKDQPRGEFVFARAAGQKPGILSGGPRLPAGDAEAGGDRQEDQPPQIALYLRPAVDRRPEVAHSRCGNLDNVRGVLRPE